MPHPHHPHPHTATRRAFIQTLAASAIAAPFLTRNLLAAPPSRTLRHASFGASGHAWPDMQQIAACDNVDIVAICDVDLTTWPKAKEAYPRARFYQDWRELLDKEHANIDTASISVPDHMHAPIAISAMQLGKHIYCQKPLAHSLHETRRMIDIARSAKVVTQMGIQVHTSAYYRMAVQLIQDGAIGKIKEVHSWSRKSWGDMAEKPTRSDTPPPDLAWDLWLGVRDARPYIGDAYYHPKNWRKRLDFGTGTLGDMACHIFDPVFESLALASPIAVRSEGPRPNNYNWALNAKVIYTFAPTPHTTDQPLTLTWTDGTQKPPAEIRELLENKPLPFEGSIFIGTKGVMLLQHVAAPVLLPAAKFADYKKPHVQGTNHWRQFIEACREDAPAKATTNFDYAGPLTEAVLLGGVAARFPKTTLRWSTHDLKFDHAPANQYVRRDYREGWKVKGL